MIVSNKRKYDQAYVWIWLPHQSNPVPAGKLSKQGAQLVFNYSQSYLEREDAIAIYNPELPLRSGLLPLLPGLSMPGCIRDASPDAWGRRVLLNKMLGLKGAGVDTAELSELAYLLESGSDRIGALDFQRSPTHYEPRGLINVALKELIFSAAKVEEGIPLMSKLDEALCHGSSIGGARPKALIESDHKKYVAKFSSSSDLFSVVKAEFVAMRLAKLVGLNVAPVSLKKSAHKDVLLIERFDRVKTKTGWHRKNILSALTLFGFDEMMARYASYEDLCAIIRHQFDAPKETLKELFGRLVFNILCGNTDDHARNHAAFWDGEQCSLTPAYDLCPQSRSGQIASQAMIIVGDDRRSRLSVCLDAAPQFLISQKEALSLIEHQMHQIGKQWISVCEEAKLNETDQVFLWRHSFLNPYAFEELPRAANALKNLAEKIRNQLSTSNRRSLK